VRDATLSETELAVVESVRRFIAGDVRPNVAQLERGGAYPEKLVHAMRDIGLFGILVPEKFGGLGLRMEVVVRILEVLAAGWTTLAAYVNSHCTVAYLIATHGTPEQRAHFLPRMASGAMRAALCLTEPGAGSDLQAIQAAASVSGSSLTLSGTKIYVTNGARAGLLAVLAKTDPQADPPKAGISLLLVESAHEGVNVGSAFKKMAYGHVDTVEVSFAHVKLSAGDILGRQPGRGMQQLLDGLEVGRLLIAASAVGLAAAAIAEARRFAAERKTFGTTIDQHQAIQLRLADMITRLVAARLMTMEAARQKELGKRADLPCGMAKLYASEACMDIVQDALRIHGGHGYINDYAIERLYREVPLYVLGEGTNDMQKLLIARRLQSGNAEEFLGLPQ
jgi:alkylation response protein AidB-like acyl-CoA dehydrogenase